MDGMGTAELEERLAETQQSLSVALARIEAYRCRERALLRDYEALKHRARAAGIDLKAPPPPEAALRSDQPTTSPLQQAAEASAVASASAPTHLALTALNEQHPLWIKTAHGRVPGTLLVAGNELHFVETHARVAPGDYLGLRALKGEKADDGRLHRAESMASMRTASGDSQPLQRASSGQRSDSQNGAGGGVLSGAATWLAQKVRVSGSGGGGQGDDKGEATTSLGFTNIMTTIMHSLEDDSSDEAERPEPEGNPPPPPLRRPAPHQPASTPPVPERTPYTGPSESAAPRLWDIAWADSFGHMRRLQFEANLPTRSFIHAQVQAWSEAAAAASMGAGSAPSLAETAFSAAQPVVACGGCGGAVVAATLPAAPSRDGRTIAVRVLSALDLELAAPEHMRPLELPPVMDSASGIVREDEARCVAGSLPSRHRQSAWALQYSTRRHGISLHTLYRRSPPAPTLLLVRDSNGYVFGAFTPEGWHVGTRFFGTGETFVFQLKPHRVAWRWKRATGDLERNDYFMFGAPESLAVGGGGHFALFLQEDLLRGSSGISATFGNGCLASANEFTVGQVELWSLSRT